MAEKSIYRRLTAKKRTLLGFTQLWIAPDHLLLLKSTRFAESYQRFSFADIQSIVVTEMPDAKAFQFLVLAGIITGAVGFLSVDSLAARIFFGAIGAIALLAMIGNIALGPRCRCVLNTAITHEELAPLSRTRSAQKVLDRLRPMIEAVQGSLTPDRAAAVDLPRESFEKPPAVASSPGYLPESLFILFLINAALVLAGARFPKLQIPGILVSTIFGEIVLSIVALVRRPGRDPRQIIYGIIVAALLCMGWDAFQLASGITNGVNSFVEAARRGVNTPPDIRQWIGFAESGAIFAAVWRLIAGSAGLISAWMERE